MSNNGKFLRRLPWFVLACVLSGIFLLSTERFNSEATGHILGSLNDLARKFAHFSEYALLFLVMRWVGAGLVRQHSAPAASLVVLGLCFLYAFCDEWHQSFVPNRTSSALDVLIDCLGAAFGLVLWQVCRGRIRSNPDQTSNAKQDRRVVMKRVFIVSDPGKDLDDECTFVLAAALERLGLIKLIGVVAALVPAAKRALLAKGTLKELNLPDVPVGVGSDMRPEAGSSDHEFAGVPYMASASEVCAGSKVFMDAFANAPDRSITLLIMAGMADVAAFMRSHEGTFRAKLEQVVIMGGVEQADDAVIFDRDGCMKPDSAANNAFDPAASSFVYKRLQELSVPLIVLSREAVYASQLPSDIYDKMAVCGHPVGVKVGYSQRRMVEDLWRCVNLPVGDPARLGLPARFNRQWFCEKYCQGLGRDRAATDSIWDLVRTANLYDPMALLAVLPDLLARFYAPVVVQVKGVEHRIIGLSKNCNGLKSRPELVDYLSEHLLAGLSVQKAD
jgi:VanZ family protein/inosine-uridine nucleoside N-ribohydrolase